MVDQPTDAGEPPSPTVRDLRLAKAQGNRVLGEMLARYRPWVRRWLVKAGAAKAELDDLESAVVVRILSAHGKMDFGTSAQFRVWLRSVATHVAIDAHRRHRRNPVRGASSDTESARSAHLDPPSPQPGVVTQANARDLLAIVMARMAERLQRISRLNEPQRELVEMREVQCLTFREIAAEQNRRAAALGIDKPKSEASVMEAYRRITVAIGRPMTGVSDRTSW